MIQIPVSVIVAVVVLSMLLGQISLLVTIITAVRELRRVLHEADRMVGR